MNKLQKFGRDNLIVIALICPLTALLTLMSVNVFGRTLSVELVVRHFTVLTYVILMFTAKQTRRVFRMRKEGQNAHFDERDQLISYRAVLCVYYAICIFLFVGLVSSIVFLYEIGSFPFYVLPMSLAVFAFVVVLIYSVAILVQYGWGGKEK